MVEHRLTTATTALSALLALLLSWKSEAFGLSRAGPRPWLTKLKAEEISEKDFESVAEPLLWETLEELDRQPVLDLSARHTQDGGGETNVQDEVEISGWVDGVNWALTRRGLEELGIPCGDEPLFTTRCPQLVRLESDMVLETATTLIREFNNTIDVITGEPRLLSFRSDDVLYGIRFLSVMMMMPSEIVKKTCIASPTLLLHGVEQGLQERAVKSALGSAGSATSDANKRIVGDAAATWNQLRKNKPKL